MEKLEDIDQTNPELKGADVDDAEILEELEDVGGSDEDKAEHKAKYDARREAATPHAQAAKDLFTKRRELMGQVNLLDDSLGKHREVLRALDPKMKHEAYADDKELRNYLKPEKVELKKKKKLDKKSAEQVMGALLKVADVLDAAEDLDGLEVVESALKIFAAKTEIPQYDVKTTEKTERKYPEAHTPAPTMSVRGCPDHNGAQVKRIADNSYQCSLDGKIYNWNDGFKDYAGNTYPPAQISSADFPDMNERMFETRDMAQGKRQK